MKSALLVFVKNAVPGKVKTRLARTIGDEKALAVYQQLLQHTRAICQTVKADKFLFYSDVVVDDAAWIDFEPRLQIGEHLGEKMGNAFSHVFYESAYEKAVIIGSDCLELTEAIICEAFTQLDRVDVVMGPAKDGGYYLLGMKTLHPSFFENKAWSTDKVLQQTLESIHAENLAFFLLPVLNDIDEEKDLQGTHLMEV